MKNLHLPKLFNKDIIPRHGEDKYKALVENSIHAYFLLKPDGSIIESNHVAISMFGYSAYELVTLNKKDLFDHTDENLILALKEDGRQTYVSVHATGIKKNGDRFPIELSSVIFTDANADTRTSIMVYNISEQKITETRYQQKLLLLQQAEQVICQGTFEYDPASGSIFYSDEFFRIVDKSPSDLGSYIGQLLEIIDPADHEILHKAFTEIEESNAAPEIKFRVPGKESRRINCKLKQCQPGTRNGKIIGIVQDITKKEIHELDLNNIIESITDGFFTLDNDWIIRYWNKAVANMSGISADEIVGKSFLNYFKDMENLKFYEECRIAKQKNISVHFEEYYPKAGLWLKVSAYPSENGLTVFSRNITRQKSDEMAMKLSNDRYNMVVNATNDLVWDWNILTGEIERNEAGVNRVYGHNSNEDIRTNQLWANHIHPLDRERIDRELSYYISSENESSFCFEYRFRREDGRYNYIEDKGYVVRNELGIVTRLIGAACDITSSKRAEQSIRESEQRYKLFIQQNIDGIWRAELPVAQAIDTPVEDMIAYFFANAYIAECNDAFAKTYGFESAEAVVGWPIQKILPPANPSSNSFLQKFFSNNLKLEDELSFEQDAAGNRLFLLNNMVGIVEDNKFKRVWGTQKNITAQKKTEESLVASEEQYRYLFNNNPSCIFIWEMETFRFMEVNRSAVDLYGYTQEEFLQLSVLDLHPENNQADFREFAKVAHNRDVYKRVAVSRHLNKSGQTVFMEVSSHNIIYKGKRAVLAIANNVTEKTQLENSLNEERQLRQKQITDAVLTGQERERSELGEELHDNINQILASTRLYLECAMSEENVRKDLVDKGRLLLDSAMKEIRKLSKTLLPPSLGEVSLVEALNDISDDIQLLNPLEISHNWEHFNEDGLSEKLKLTIFRIVQEQLNNIYKHSKAKNVSISLERNEELISLVIKDDGIGFNVLTKKTGVGLRNICSRAEVNNGNVHIQSKPGAGCELRVQFLLNA